LLNSSIIKKIKTNYGVSGKEALSITLLNRGGYANANVYKVDVEGAEFRCLTVKDFSQCNILTKYFIAPFLIRRERYYLTLLKDILQVDAGCVKALSPYVIAFPYIKGRSLAQLKKNDERIGDDFFLKLEKLVKALHRQSVVHLDIRNLGNIIYSDKEPFLIDFQSAVSTRLMPRFFRKLLEESDLSGVYKGWRKCGINPLPEEKEQKLRRLNKIRKFWVFRKKALRNRLPKSWRNTDKV